jgi:hypothetical protein
MNYQKAYSATYMNYWMAVRPSQEEDDDAQKNHHAKERPTSEEKLELGLGLRNKLISKL